MTDPMADLFALSDAWCSHTGLSEATLSTRLLRDGKRLSRLRGGADIGVRTVMLAISRLSQEWPSELPWPDGVDRPVIERNEEAA